MSKRFSVVFGPKPLPPHLSVEIVSQLDRLYAVRKEWLELENRAQDPLTYFQSFDWCEKWCRIFAPEVLKGGGSIHIVLIRNKGKLAAVLPLVIENRRNLALVLRFAGEPMIQYAKALMDPNAIRVDELRSCLDHVTHHAKCDSVYLDHLVHGSALHSCLEAGECHESRDDYASAISLTGFASRDDYAASLSRQTRKSRNRKRRKLEAQGRLAFHAVNGNEPAFEKLCAIALQQKRIWLAETGRRTNKLEDERMLRMLGELGVDTGAYSGAVAFSLSLDGVPIALEIGFWRHEHYYSYLGSFDWSMRDYSPGKLLLEETVAWAIENGFATYDLLGNPSPYKEALANKRIPLVAYAHGKTLIGDAYARLWRPRVKPSIKLAISGMPMGIRQVLFSAAGRLGARQSNF